MLITCYICGEKGHDARRHFVPSEEEKERVRIAQEDIRKKIEERRNRKITRGKSVISVIKRNGRKISQCSICGSFDHTKPRHGKEPRVKIEHGTRDNHRCSVCGEQGHHANWHRQEEIKSMTEKECRSCGRVLPVSYFKKSLETYRTGGEEYIYYSPTCKECGYIRSSMDQKKPSQEGKEAEVPKVPTVSYDINQALNRAKARSNGLKYSLDIDLSYLEGLYKQQDGKCYYSGLPLTPSGPSIISIDRVDSSCGYTKGNVVLCCGSVNTMKSSMSADSFVDLCGAIWKHSHKEDQLPKE